MFANPCWKSADNRRMYAWRARVGIVNPTHRGKVFALWYKTAPEGVEIIPTFVGFQSARAAGQALYTTSLKALDDVSYIEVYQYCTRGVRRLERPVDGLYINGGGWDAAPAVTALEADLNTKVVFAQAAEIWLMY